MITVSTHFVVNVLQQIIQKYKLLKKKTFQSQI